MALLDRFDFSHGDLPPWLPPLVSLTRPLAVSLTGMLIPVGAFTCGSVALFSLEAGMNMAAASAAFLRGIPGELYALIGGVFGVYSLSKTAEVIKAPSPAGGTSPEAPPTTEVVAEAEVGDAVDSAPRGRP
jgi:hypothetical protein